MVATWAAQSIDLGPGSVFRPQVIHPERIPKIVDAREAARDPHLATLSVIAHGKGDPDVAVRIALALGEAIEALPGAEHSLYSHLIDNALSDDAKEKIKMMPEPPQVLQRDVPPVLGAGCRRG